MSHSIQIWNLHHNSNLEFPACPVCDNLDDNTLRQGRTYRFWLGGCNHEMRQTHHWNVNPDRLLVSWCVAIKLSTKHGNWWHLLGILQEHEQFAVKRYIFIKCPRLVRFDHGLAISSRSIVSVRSRSHAKSQEFTKVFLVHYWTHNSFHWFWL
jgi:hypothetical protein